MKAAACSPAKLLTLLLLLSTGIASAGHAASFDCDAGGLTADEKMICTDRELNDLDVKMATEFDFLSGLMAMGMRGKLQVQQSKWLVKRQSCGAYKRCIKAAYEARLKEFDEIYNKIDRPVPWR